MPKVVGVQFKPAGKIYYFLPGDLELKIGDHVIVETIRGVEYASIRQVDKNIPDDEVEFELKSVIRLATEEDAEINANNIALAEDAFGICLEKIKNHALEMKLISSEYTFDKAKIIFSFIADGRIDFRELVKDLAAVFHTRIEMRQIGVRDEAKQIGGIGICGRPLCCHKFLGDFSPVSIKLAKDQNLSLNPTKISGCCGRLLCCLNYETENYENGEFCACSCAAKEIPDDPEVTELDLTLLEEEEAAVPEASNDIEIVHYGENTEKPARQNRRKKPFRPKNNQNQNGNGSRQKFHGKEEHRHSSNKRNNNKQNFSAKGKKPRKRFNNGK